MSDTLCTLDGDELCTLLENEHDFYTAWSTQAQAILRHCFDIRREGRNQYTVAYFWQLNGLSFSSQEISTSRMYSLVSQFSRQLAQQDHYVIDYTAQETATRYFTEKALRQIRCGELTLAADLEATLTTLYAYGENVNVARATRELNQTRHHINKLIDTYSYQMFTRYRRVQAGKPYAIVMGDCAPYIQNYPPFTPVQRIDMEALTDHVFHEGDFVAEWGSMRWYEVGALTSSGRCIFTKKLPGGDSPILSGQHIRVLPKRYREVAAQFCDTIHGMPARQYLAQTH